MSADWQMSEAGLNAQHQGMGLMGSVGCNQRCKFSSQDILGYTAWYTTLVPLANHARSSTLTSLAKPAAAMHACNYTWSSSSKRKSKHGLDCMVWCWWCRSREGLTCTKCFCRPRLLHHKQEKRQRQMRQHYQSRGV